MHIAKCEGCKKEVEFETYKRDWPEGWALTGISQWGKEYHRQSGWGWWCPECNKHEICLDKMPGKLPAPVRHALRKRPDAVTILQGYSYPLARLADVLAHEARQGRMATIAIQHAGGWTVAEGALPDIATDELTELLQALRKYREKEQTR